MHVADFVPKYIDAAPSVYRGCSLKELLIICSSALIINLIIWVTFMTCLGIPMVGFGLAILATLLSSAGLTLMMQRLKRGRPPHYHLTRIRIWASQQALLKPLVQTHYIQHTTAWQTGRTP